MEPETGDFILASYREIALRFGLGGPNAARTKARRAGWVSEPPNHPADPLRIRVPREVWDQARESPPPSTRERRDRKPRDGTSQADESRHIKALEGHLETLRERLVAAEARAERERDRNRDLLADLIHQREQRARAEGAVEAKQAEIERLLAPKRRWWRRRRE
jgi:hypothetical protein